MNPPAGSPRIARLPIDGPTGLPVPYTAATMPNGATNFKTIDPARKAAIIRHELCGVCGQKQGRFKAFIGGFHAAALGVFLDPPMHRTCAEAALTLCPHIALGRKVGNDTSLEGRVRPEAWYLYVARGYTLTTATTLSDRQPPTIAFKATPPVVLHRYHYLDGRLASDRPITQNELPQTHRPAGDA